MEFKVADAPRMTRSMRSALSDLELEHLWIVYPGQAAYRLEDRVTVLPLAEIHQAARLAGTAQVRKMLQQGSRPAGLGLYPVEYGLQVFGQNLIEQAVLWLVTLVGAGERAGGGIHAAAAASAAPAGVGREKPCIGLPGLPPDRYARVSNRTQARAGRARDAPARVRISCL